MTQTGLQSLNDHASSDDDDDAAAIADDDIGKNAVDEGASCQRPDDDMDNGLDADARDMSMEPPEQSGYPADPGDAEEGKHDESPREEMDLTSEAEVISIGDESDNDGCDNNDALSIGPEGSGNTQGAPDAKFLAAVKKQTIVKEGDWTQIRQQSGSSDYGVIDID